MKRALDSSFLRLVARELADDWKGLVAVTVFAGASDALLIVVINSSTAEAVDGALSISHLIMFVSMLAIHALTRFSMLIRSGIAMKNIVYRFRTRISERMTQVELVDFERMGKPDLQFVLGRDIGFLSTPSAHFFSVPATFVTTALSLIYLGYLSRETFIIVLLMNIGYGIYFLDNRLRVMETMKETGQVESNLFTKISHLSLGFKELKLHQKRRKSLLNQHLIPISARVREGQHRINTELAINFTSSDVYYYCAVGLTLYILPSMQILVGQAASSAITVMIFLFGNLGEILFAFSILLQYDLAVNRLQALEKSLERPAPDANAVENLKLLAQTGVEEIKLTGCTFSYYDDKQNPTFSVGPMDLTVSRGELIFVVGGNGSGKSTFLRLFCGLYLPVEGTLACNGIAIGPNNVETYRQYFSTVFSDFHLFDQFYGLEEITDEQVRTLQKRFMLEDKTLFKDHHFSTLQLSTGQRKRLALLTAMLEDRPILILDEVSADQDPEFRRFYYEVLLPELKARGKTVLVVSHDDRFFHTADRVLYMDYGNLDLTRDPHPGRRDSAPPTSV